MNCNDKKREHEKRNCLFCHWVFILNDKALSEYLEEIKKKKSKEEYDKLKKELDREKEELENRIVDENKKENWFAILDRYPKILGHTLVISGYPFDDFTDEMDDLPQKGKEHKTALFIGAIKVSEKLKKLFPCGKDGKVYLVTMCDHYEIWEARFGKTTEHLHFHLIPRHPGMDIKAEKLISKEGEKDWTPEDFKKIKELINDRRNNFT